MLAMLLVCFQRRNNTKVTVYHETEGGDIENSAGTNQTPAGANQTPAGANQTVVPAPEPLQVDVEPAQKMSKKKSSLANYELN